MKSSGGRYNSSAKSYGYEGKDKWYVPSHHHIRLMEACEGFMPELPEIANLARQMTKQLKGKRITGLDLTQPKCLNMPAKKFRRIMGKTAQETSAHGKWLFTGRIHDSHSGLSRRAQGSVDRNRGK